MKKVTKFNRMPLMNNNEFFKKMRTAFKSDIHGVSEAIGTILLLSISIALVGVVAYWVQTLPSPEKVINANFEGTLATDPTGDHIVQIKHMGGDRLDVDSIDILVKINGITQGYYKLYDSTISEFDNGFWDVSEIWMQNIESLHNWAASRPEVIVEIKDIDSDSLLYTKKLQFEGTLGDLPDLEISEEDISFSFFNQTLRRGDWVNISAKVHNIGAASAASVIVRFFDGAELISKNSKDYVFINSIATGAYQTVWINWTPDYSGLQIINVKVYSPQIEENFGNNYASKKLEVEPIIPVITGPNLEVESIQFSPETPTHGDWVTITVLVKNIGDEEIPKGSIIGLSLWDEKGYLITKGTFVNKSVSLTSNLTVYETLQPPFTTNNQTTFGGITTIWAEIWTDVNESYSDDNILYKHIQILPTILLVDDDGVFERYTKDDASSYMDAALQLAVGSGQFEILTVKGVDGPKYNSGDKPLKNYDIVIWMTGYQKTNTLTSTDQSSIRTYLENKGKLWLIGMNILDDIGAPNSYAYNYLGIINHNTMGTPEILYGVKGENITEGMELNTTNMIEKLDRGTNLTLRNTDYVNHSIDGILGNDAELGFKGNMSLKYFNQTKDFKVVYFGWEFASIIDMVDRNNLTIQILKWFGWELEIGTDLAISSKGFDNQNPNFMDWITINARVRNNGPKDLSRVRVDFFVIDENGVETRIREYPGLPFEEEDHNPRFRYIPGGGGEITVEKKWLAITVGRHTFRVVVDLEDEIEEVSEENNDDFYSPLFVTQLYIGYTILVVDDDNSTNNGGNEINATEDITNSLDELGYIYDFQTVRGGLAPAPGPNITVMKHYNCVIWSTGFSRNDTLLDKDQEELTYYFTRTNFTEADFLGETRFNAWLVGQGILDDIGGSGMAIAPPTDSFIYDKLRIKLYSTVNTELPRYLDGVKGDNITHGLSYPIIQSGMDKADLFDPLADATGIFWQDPDHIGHNTLRHNSTTHNLIFMPWVFSFIDDSSTSHLINESYKDELVYLLMRWFSYPDERFELKTSSIDIKLSSYNPVLGASYIIKSNVFNLGNNNTNAIVRFLDGDTIINTKSIFVPANSNSSTEVIWSPLYAGYRDIKIAVDPENDIDEVFDKLNNDALLLEQPVFFFYDDLENGTSNWGHETSLVLINGESPLEYMDLPVHSDVSETWDLAYSHGFYGNTTDYHSYNQSYYTVEPKGGPLKVPLDIVLVLDTSGSMSGDPISDLKTAAQNFIKHEMLDARDRVAIYRFSGESPSRARDFTVCDQSGKNSLISTIQGLSASGYTPLWDSIGAAVNYANTSGSSRTPLVIAMTDGEDYGNQGPEDGSETYCPWHNWSAGEKRYHDIDGSGGHDNVRYDGSGSRGSISNWQWNSLDDEYRYGLLNCDLMKIYTVGLGLSHDNHSADSCYWFPNGWMGAHMLQEAQENSWSIWPSWNLSKYWPYGTPEFYLWHVANTSNAEYFYASESSQLNTIFQSIAATIVEETTVQRSSRAEPSDISADGRSGVCASESLSDEAENTNPRGSRESSRSRAQIFSDGFETGNWNGGPWSATTGWSVENDNPRTGTYHAEGCRDDSNRRLTLNRDLNLSRYEDVKLIIYQYTYETESSDAYNIDVSTNSGSSWTNIKYWNGGQLLDWSEEYSRYEIDLSSYDGSNKFRFRLRFTSSSGSEWWHVDDISVIGNTTGLKLEDIFKPGDRNLTTYPFSLKNITSARLSFYQKYNLRNGLNGVVVMVGTPDPSSGEYKFEYVRPTQPYTNNLLVSQAWYDDYGNRMMWCWNGISRNGKFKWDYIQVDLSNWTGLPRVRVKIAFLWAAMGDGGSYLIDDFKIKATRNESLPISADSQDQWEYTDVYSHSGTYSWWNHNATTNHLSGGLDNSLYTRPIDLTNARNATLSAYFKFNINTESGRPPDGFRVEISEDNGITWKAINMGVRTAWGVSLNGTDGDDGVIDGKSYSGIDISPTEPDPDGWVEADTLTRLNTDITGWAGSVITLRFRVVTASDSNPYFKGKHYEWATPVIDCYGFLVDDVIIYGFSLLN